MENSSVNSASIIYGGPISRDKCRSPCDDVDVTNDDVDVTLRTKTLIISAHFCATGSPSVFLEVEVDSTSKNTLVQCQASF